MTDIGNLKISLIRGLRGGLLAALGLLMLDILALHNDYIMNFVMIAIIVFICSFLVFVTSFLFKFSKVQTNMKVIAWVFLIVTLIVMLFLQYPFINHLMPDNFNEASKGSVKISIGKIETLSSEFQKSAQMTSSEKNGSVEIGIS